MKNREKIENEKEVYKEENHTPYKWIAMLSKELGKVSELFMEENISFGVEELVRLSAIADAAASSIERNYIDLSAIRKSEDDFLLKSNLFADVARKNSLKTVWSIYDIKDMEAPHRYGERIYKIKYGNRTYFFNETAKTWKDLYLMADEAIRKSGDMHHIFIEDFLIFDKNTLTLLTGS